MLKNLKFIPTLQQCAPFDIDVIDDLQINNLIDPQQWNTFKSSKYYKTIIQKCYNHISKEPLSDDHDIINHISGHCDVIFSYLFDLIQHGFEYYDSEKHKEVQDILALFINYCDSINLFDQN